MSHATNSFSDLIRALESEIDSSRRFTVSTSVSSGEPRRSQSLRSRATALPFVSFNAALSSASLTTMIPRAPKRPRVSVQKNKSQGKDFVRPSFKVSNRPRDSSSSSSSNSDDANDDEDPQAAMLAALQRHQAQFIADALPPASNSANNGSNRLRVDQVRRTKQSKSIWEMELDDLDEDDDSDSREEEVESDDGDESEYGGDERSNGPKASISSSTIARRVPEVAVFIEPRLGGSISAPPVDTQELVLPSNNVAKSNLKEFMSSKVKNTRTRKASIADQVNARRVGKSRASGQNNSAAIDTEEEAHLASLDSALSSLIRPLTSNTTSSTHSQLPALLETLPTAPTKPLKGHTPLPSNAPRSLRAGQSAANLKRARARDEAAGVLMGAKKGREALSLKEKRHEEGSDKRQRGLKGAVGKMGRGELRLSKEEIRSVMGGGVKGSGKGAKGSKGAKGRR